MKGEQGLALMMALIALFLVAIICGPLFSQVRAGLTSTQVGDGLVAERYSAGAGVEHAIWRLVYEPGFSESLTGGSPTVEYTRNINSDNVTITVTKLGTETPPGTVVDVYKVVSPTSALAGAETTFTYTITVENLSAVPQEVFSLSDLLPEGFSYVAGSSTGITTTDPLIILRGEEVELEWDFTPTLAISAGEALQQGFQATATLVGGTYLNEAWAKVVGLDKVSSGKTAPVVVPLSWSGLSIEKVVSPSSTRIGQDTTFTYTIYIENVDTVSIDCYELGDLLPVDFSYVAGSTSGITTADPGITIKPDGSEQLKWQLSPSIPFSPGESRQLAFRAVAVPDEGSYWNEAWVYYHIGEDDFSSLTSPTAPVQAYSQYDIMATAGGFTALVAATVSQGTVTVLSWQVE